MIEPPANHSTMPRIILTCQIAAPIERCFDLARSIDFHMASMSATGERAIAGRTSGLIELHEEVTWEATHFGRRQQLTSRITAFSRPHRFTDEQVKGAFKSFRHEHRFEQVSPQLVQLTDDFEFASPLGPLGSLANTIFLTRYMRSLITAHQDRLKQHLESD